MDRKEAMETLEGKTTQQLLSKSVLWQFQIAAIESASGPAVERRRSELTKELDWIKEVIIQRPDVTESLRERFGENSGSVKLSESNLTSVAWNGGEYDAKRIDFYDEESVQQVDASKNPKVKVVHTEPSKPPKQIIGMSTLDMKVKHGFEP